MYMFSEKLEARKNEALSVAAVCWEVRGHVILLVEAVSREVSAAGRHIGVMTWVCLGTWLLHAGVASRLSSLLIHFALLWMEEGLNYWWCLKPCHGELGYAILFKNWDKSAHFQTVSGQTGKNVQRSSNPGCFLSSTQLAITGNVGLSFWKVMVGHSPFLSDIGKVCWQEAVQSSDKHLLWQSIFAP